jgi:hypothetical protein
MKEVPTVARSSLLLQGLDTSDKDLQDRRLILSTRVRFSSLVLAITSKASSSAFPNWVLVPSAANGSLL